VSDVPQAGFGEGGDVSKTKLEWEDGGSEEFFEVADCQGAGIYIAERYRSGWRAGFSRVYDEDDLDWSKTGLPTIEAAKAACQRHWEEQQ